MSILQRLSTSQSFHYQRLHCSLVAETHDLCRVSHDLCCLSHDLCFLSIVSGMSSAIETPTPNRSTPHKKPYPWLDDSSGDEHAEPSMFMEALQSVDKDTAMPVESPQSVKTHPPLPVESPQSVDKMATPMTTEALQSVDEVGAPILMESPQSVDKMATPISMETLQSVEEVGAQMMMSSQSDGGKDVFLSRSTKLFNPDTRAQVHASVEVAVGNPEEIHLSESEDEEKEETLSPSVVARGNNGNVDKMSPSDSKDEDDNNVKMASPMVAMVGNPDEISLSDSEEEEEEEEERAAADGGGGVVDSVEEKAKMATGEMDESLPGVLMSERVQKREMGRGAEAGEMRDFFFGDSTAVEVEGDKMEAPLATIQEEEEGFGEEGMEDKKECVSGGVAEKEKEGREEKEEGEKEKGRGGRERGGRKEGEKEREGEGGKEGEREERERGKEGEKEKEGERERVCQRKPIIRRRNWELYRYHDDDSVN